MSDQTPCPDCRSLPGEDQYDGLCEPCWLDLQAGIVNGVDPTVPADSGVVCIRASDVQPANVRWA